MLRGKDGQRAEEAQGRIVFPVVQVLIEGKRTRDRTLQAGEETGDSGPVSAKLFWEKPFQMSLFALDDNGINDAER